MHGLSPRSPWGVVRDAALVVALSVGAAVTLNATRPTPLAWIQREPYALLVPCPETSGEAAALGPDAPALRDDHNLVVDARGATDFEGWHWPTALSVPYDYLEATPPATIARVAATGAREVVVYGDGADPDSGEQLARELSGKGIRNVSYIRGGAAALQSHQSSSENAHGGSVEAP